MVNIFVKNQSQWTARKGPCRYKNSNFIFILFQLKKWPNWAQIAPQKSPDVSKDRILWMYEYWRVQILSWSRIESSTWSAARKLFQVLFWDICVDNIKYNLCRSSLTWAAFYEPLYRTIFFRIQLEYQALHEKKVHVLSQSAFYTVHNMTLVTVYCTQVIAIVWIGIIFACLVV